MIKRVEYFDIRNNPPKSKLCIIYGNRPSK